MAYFVPYIWYSNTEAAGLRKQFTYPSKAMNANSMSYPTEENPSAVLKMSASSEYNSYYPAWRAGDYSTTAKPWSSKVGNASDSCHFLQMNLPRSLYDISVTIHERGDSTTLRAIKNGRILGSYPNLRDNAAKNNSTAIEDNFVELLNWVDRVPGDAVYNLSSSNQSYDQIRIEITDPKPGTAAVCIGELRVTGYDIKSSGDWIPAQKI